MMAPAGTLLDPRQADGFLQELLQRSKGYVPGWQPSEGQASDALLRIYARYLQALNERVNLAPAKNRLAFFDLLGINLIPAQAAVAPVVFKAIAQMGDSRVPERTQVAASVPGRDEPLVFETRNTVGLAAAQLVEVVSLWPGKDGWADHTQAALGEQPFTLFDRLKLLPHELYLAHDTHFAIAGKATVDVQFELVRPGSEPLDLEWQYWDGELWRNFKPFQPAGAAQRDDSLDGTDGLTRSGSVRLVADCAETKPRRVNGIESYWIRARTTQPLPPSPGLRLPLLDKIAIRTTISNEGLAPDSAFIDSLKLDVSGTFYLFGQQPQPGTALYVASEEALGKPGAVVNLHLTDVETPQQEGGPLTSDVEVAVEYWNGFRWQALANTPDKAEFAIPSDIEKATVNGVDGFWMRMRIVEGGFYRTRTITWTSADETPNEIVVTETVPPAVTNFSLSYEYSSPLDSPRACFVYSDFQWTDRTGDARWRGGSFEPFAPTADRVPTVYLGFDCPLPADVLGLYFDVQEVPGLHGPLLRWEAFDGRDWLPVAVTDETADLTRPGIVNLTWPGSRPLPAGEAVIADGTTVQMANARQAAAFRANDLLYVGEAEKGEPVTVDSVAGDTVQLKAPVSKTYQRAPVSVAMLPRFGRPRTWLRARLQTDGEPLLTRVNGVFFNAVWAEQVRTFEGETLGASTGEPNQSLFFRQTPVLPGEVIEVRELSGARAAVELPILLQDLAQAGIDAGAVRTVTDPRSGAISEVWVRWEQRPNLFFSGPDDRHYTIERSRGRVVFGDNVHGRIPPAGPDNVRAARYTSGGGTIGNVPAGALSQLLSGVPAESVTNPRAAEGGADGETVEAVATRAPLVTRHRNQAISLEDYEALAREASPAVAVARALPLTQASGRPAVGWVKLIIQPNSHEPRPQPSFGLRRRVEQYVRARIPAAMGGRISVTGPDYLPIGVATRIVAVDPTRSGVVYDAAVGALQAFFHPVTGGPDGTGWPFGRDVYLSDVAAVLEAVPGLDYVLSLLLLLDSSPVGEVVPVPSDRMVVAGDIRVTLSGKEA